MRSFKTVAAIGLGVFGGLVVHVLSRGGARAKPKAFALYMGLSLTGAFTSGLLFQFVLS